MDGLCVVCHHREPSGGGYVCDVDAETITSQLRDLPRKMHLLRLQVVPGQPDRAERVTISRVGSPMPARLDALSLTGPGSAQPLPGLLHPLVRRWQTTHTVTVAVTLGATVIEDERHIIEWHRELARDEAGNPITVAPDDQIGSIPPAEWLGSWVRRWRAAFKHTAPPRTGRSWPRDERAAREQARRVLTFAAARPQTAPLVASMLAVDAAWRQHIDQAMHGLVPGYAGTAPTSAYTEDPLRDEWEVRFGEPPPAAAPAADVGYLLTWLAKACELDIGVAELAAELRALTAEMSRVLGEEPDQQWLGRCPARLTDHDDGATRPCGAALWQDPHHAAQVVCPRCRATWGPGKTALLYLAQAIRKTWPVDRRRRYHADQIKALRPLRCPGCGCEVHITWRDVTATVDERRWWRPDKAQCPSGCDEAARLI